MSDSERVKGLLDGSMDPTELEGDTELYALAERIYGREALEEMGVAAPERPPEVHPPLSAEGDNLGVELPEFEGDPEDLDGKSASGGPRRRWFVLLIGLIGASLVGVNVAVGIGQFLPLCVDDLEPDPLSFTVTANEQDSTLYVTWTVANLNLSTSYSIQWYISQNGSSEVVDDGFHNWTSSLDSYAHTEHRSVTTAPWCFISSLYEESVKVSEANGCIGDSSTVSTLASVSPSQPMCEDHTRLLWEKASDYGSIESWTSSGTGDLIDGALLMLFGLMTLLGLFSKKE